ncbi:unnamed protein product [Allacma fusca]|uniref:Uncharacterized protein n=1 Tax=Allacma fusca TaxID=39272 RepID=A0A8J2JQ52_9HEXA|nr:unnamed protein product [Allacma fusca]
MVPELMHVTVIVVCEESCRLSAELEGLAAESAGSTAFPGWIAGTLPLPSHCSVLIIYGWWWTRLEMRTAEGNDGRVRMERNEEAEERKSGGESRGKCGLKWRLACESVDVDLGGDGE